MGIYKLIKIDNVRGKFHVSCHPTEAGPVRRVPGCRWNAASRSWVCQPSRLAKAALVELSHRGNVEVSPAARVELDAKPAAIFTRPWPADFPFKTEPFDHQREALAFGNGRKVLALHMEAGTGKTKIAIDLMTAAIMDGSATNFIIICPVSVRRNWQKEFVTHSPVAINTFVLDSGKPVAFEKWLSLHDDAPRALIVGVESLAAGKAMMLSMQYMRVMQGPVLGVIDEAHTVKNHAASRTENASIIMRHCARRINMTGTPTGNSVLDLFSPFNILDPDIIGLPSYWAFRERYAVMGGYEGRQVVGYQNLPELMESIMPHVFQVLKKDCLDLPPKVYETRYVTLSPAQSKTYKELAKHGASESGITTSMVLERMLRQQQVIAGFESIEGVESAVSEKTPPKIAELLNIAEETGEQSMIVWSVFRWEIARIAEALRAKYGEDSVVEIHGDVTPDERQERVDRFQRREARFLVGTASAGGTGLTLTAATVMVYVSNDFSYIRRAQSEDRFHRIGQTESVTIIDLIADGTIDEDVAEALANKTDVAAWLADQRRSR